eukprot:Awhi_evm1s5758
MADLNNSCTPSDNCSGCAPNKILDCLNQQSAEFVAEKEKKEKSSPQMNEAK